MKLRITLTCLLACSAFLGRAAVEQRVAWPLAKLTVHVVDEQRQPISEANVKIWFSQQFSSQPATAKGQTDGSGNFTAEGFSDMRLLSDVTKEGYYRSGSPGTVFQNRQDGKWIPWNTVAEITMRPIGRPIALCAKNGWFDIPVVDQPCGYDLEKGDWVIPFGSGLHSDLIFKLDRRYTSREDFEVEAILSFSQPLDGIQEVDLPVMGRDSVFKWQREAPENGYQPSFKTRFAYHMGKGFEMTALEEQSFFFRVRTVEQNGRIISALYGKIKGGLQLAPSDSTTSKVKLHYYLNLSPLDRNLEWDPKHNLLSGLSVEETPREP